MYGGRAFGTSPYGGINQEKPLVVFQPETFALTLTLNEPAAFTEEISGFLSITASLKAPTISLNPKKIVVKVNTVDISNQIDFTSLSVSNNLYSEPNSAFFEILKSSSKSYAPAAGDVIEIRDTGVLIFAGVLIKISKEPVGISEIYHLEFKDWTEVLANTLVAQTYTNWTVEDIIADMFSGLPEYDLTNVSDTTVITQLVSDNIPITKALDKLAELSGKYWYVSPGKEIYFFAPATLQSPYDLTDTNGKYIYDSLKIDEDLTQIRNRVTIKGKGVSAVTVEDTDSQDDYGIKEYYERDDNIDATNEATQKANAILESFKDPVKIVSFQTMTEGLFAGQQIDIDSTLRGINETLNIESVSFQSAFQNRFVYEVKATSQRLGRIEDLFAKTKEGVDTTPAIGDQGSLQDIEFTAIDNETIQWSAGTIRLADGTAYSITAKASQALTADHVIYFDPSVSETELQISDDFADGIGNGKIPLVFVTKSLVATKGADIFPVSFGGKIQLDGGVHITDRSIISDNIAANAVIALHIGANEVIANSANIKDAIITNAKIASLDASKITSQIVNAQIATIEFAKITSVSITDAMISSLSAGKITAGTIVGSTVESNANSYRVRLDASNRVLSFLLDNTEKGKLYNDANYNMFIGTLDKIVFGNLSGTGYVDFNISGSVMHMEMATNAEIKWNGGRLLRGTSSAVEVSGNFNPTSADAYTCGAYGAKWSEVWAGKLYQSTPTDGTRHCHDFAYIEMGLLPKKMQKKYLKGEHGCISVDGIPSDDITLPFKKGTILIWKNGKLQKSEKENDQRAVAVASLRGLPIVLGAEPVRINGEVKCGDYIVSDKNGCGKVDNKANSNMVIGKALQGSKSKKEKLILVMIKF